MERRSVDQSSYMLYNFVDFVERLDEIMGRSSCGEGGVKPSDEEIVHKRRNAANCTTGEGGDGIDDDLRIMLVVYKYNIKRLTA